MANSLVPRRRRERRLRLWLLLAEAYHHSSVTFPPTLEEDAYVALRGQRMARRVEPLEEVAEPQVRGSSHGRIRGCPGAVAARATVGRRGRRSRGPLHPPIPPPSRHRDAEGLGGGGEEEERGGGAGEGTERGEAPGAPPRRSLLFLGTRDLGSRFPGEEGGEAKEEKEEKEEAPEDFFALLFWPLSSSIPAVACARLVLLALYASRDVFPSVVGKPRSSASRSERTRRTFSRA